MNYDLQPPLCRASDPVTSFEAADRVKEFQSDHCTSILMALKRKGQAGAEQIAAMTSLDAYQVRKRLSDLQKRELVQPHQETRLTATGRRERLWAAL
jgi:predicted ArsR family transcriptional regulator